MEIPDQHPHIPTRPLQHTYADKLPPRHLYVIAVIRYNIYHKEAFSRSSHSLPAAFSRIRRQYGEG